MKAGEDAAGAKSYDAEEWQVKMEKMSSSLWVAKDITALAGFVDAFKAMRQNQNTAWLKDLQLPCFPCRIVTNDADGNLMSEMAIVSIDTKSPDDTLFTIPEDYKKMAMPVAPKP